MGSSSSRSARNSQPYPAAAAEAPESSPVSLSPASRVVFATPEAQASVTGPLRDRYQNAVDFATAEWEQARTCQADMDQWAQEIRDAEQAIKDRREWIAKRGGDMQQHMLHGQSACDVANPAAELLGVAGVHVERISAPVIVPAPPALSAKDRRVHPLDTSRPLLDGLITQQAGMDPSPTGVQSPVADPHVGFCIHCGQQVWRTRKSDASPNGLTHGWGASCDPNAETATHADLGEDHEAREVVS